MRSLSYLNKYFFKYKVRLGLGALFVIIGTFFSVFSVPFVGKAIDLVSSSSVHKNDPDDVAGTVMQWVMSVFGLSEKVTTQLMVLGLLILVTTVLNGIFMFLKRQTIIVMSRLIENDLKNEVYAHYQQLDIGFYKRNNTGDLMNRISEDVSKVRMYIGPAVMYIIDTVTMFVLTITFMLKVDLQLTLYVLAPLPVLAITIYYVSDAINKKSTKVQEKLSDLSTLSQETFSGIRVLKAYGMEKNAGEKYAEESIQYQQRELSLAKTNSLFQPFMLLMIGLSTLITIYIGGVEAIQGKVTTGNIAEFIVYVSRLTWPIISLGWVVSLVQRAAASQKRINEFLETKPRIISENETPFAIRGEIEFRNVSFTYPDSGIVALKNVSFKISAGETFAVIGRTGSGKSTIASLLCRLYDVDEGEILIDGKNLRSLQLHSLRRQIGYVPQEVFLFSESIADNISFSYSPESSVKPSQQAIEQAAKDAAIYTGIMEFPEKFETVIGERGITLSGGQKQRVSIARALISNPQILLFDDCLSAVDTDTEEEILSNLKRIMKGKTAVIISHRVSSVKQSNRILVMDDGRIIEEGNHDDLIRKKGVYSDLHHKQLLESMQHTV